MLWHHELDCTHSQRPEQWLQWSLRHPSIVWHLKTIVWHLLILEKNKHQNLLGLSVPFIWLRHNWIDGDLMRAILMADALSMFWGCSHVIGCMGWIVWIGVRGSGQGRMCDKMCMGPEQVREPGRERERERHSFLYLFHVSAAEVLLPSPLQDNKCQSLPAPVTPR